MDSKRYIKGVARLVDHKLGRAVGQEGSDPRYQVLRDSLLSEFPKQGDMINGIICTLNIQRHYHASLPSLECKGGTSDKMP